GAQARAVPVEDRLPPGQRLTTGFPVLDLGIRPEVSLANWSLAVDGSVEEPLHYNWEEFIALPAVEDLSDMHCVTTWSKFDCRWQGVAFTEIHQRCRPRPEATHVWFEAFDGYTVNLPLEVLLDDDVLLATHFDREPLAFE